MSDTTLTTHSPRRALIVIDVQNEYFTGNMLIDYPDPALSLFNIGRAMDAAKNAGIPILVVQHSAPVTAPIFAKGSHAWKLHDVVLQRPFDHLVEKNMPSIFTGTDVEAWLKAHDVDTLSIVGYMTHNCNASTIYHASHAGYQLEVLSDATGALPYANAAGSVTGEEIHRVFNVVFQSNFAAVDTTDHWMAAVKDGVLLQKSNVFASHLAGREQALATV
ncbi:MAG: cysteine hydrolase [Burkholderiales bacterium]|nr:cysteine hydrolase [Burkholderiales bacterium]